MFSFFKTCALNLLIISRQLKHYFQAKYITDVVTIQGAPLQKFRHPGLQINDPKK